MKFPSKSATLLLALVTMGTVTTRVAALSSMNGAIKTDRPTLQVQLTGALPTWANSGAVLTTLEWPNLSSMKVGDSLPMQILSKEVVSGGVFTIQAASLAQNNVQLFLTDGADSSIVNLGAQIDGSAGSQSDTSIERPLGTTNQRPKVTASDWIPISTGGGQKAHLSSAHLVLNVGGCTDTLENFLGYDAQPIGEMHTYAGVSGSIQYSSSTSSAVTIGVSLTGTYGSFASGGTYTVSGESSSNYPVPGGTHNFVLGSWSEGKFLEVCAVGVRGYISYSDIHYQYQPSLLKLGAAAPTNPLGSCPIVSSDYLSKTGIPVKISLGSTHEYAWGVDLLGVNLGQTVSLTSTSIMSFTPNPSLDTYLCGPGGVFPDKSPVIYNSLGS